MNCASFLNWPLVLISLKSFSLNENSLYSKVCLVLMKVFHLCLISSTSHFDCKSVVKKDDVCHTKVRLWAKMARNETTWRGQWLQFRFLSLFRVGIENKAPSLLFNYINECLSEITKKSKLSEPSRLVLSLRSHLSTLLSSQVSMTDKMINDFAY